MELKIGQFLEPIVRVCAGCQVSPQRAGQHGEGEPHLEASVILRSGEDVAGRACVKAPHNLVGTKPHALKSCDVLP